ncbi:MAG TPA: hypothetical protein DE036_10040 [Actinobacteria bacterium]|nr:hypothetical protein [Actinomycetota bacterium]
MRLSRWQIGMGLSLILLSAAVYTVHYLIFRDVHHIFIYMVGDIAFVFIEVLMVSMVLHQLMEARAKSVILQKLNMLIGVFFSEIGTKLMAYFSDIDPDLDAIKSDLIITNDWAEQDFKKVGDLLKKYDYKVEADSIDLDYLRELFSEKSDFLLRLLENPNLLEHESFTNLLQAIFHLSQELHARENLKLLPGSDREHLAIDIERIYGMIVYQWLDYMGHLKSNYPFLFSLAMRANPFDQSSSPVVLK